MRQEWLERRPVYTYRPVELKVFSGSSRQLFSFFQVSLKNFLIT